MKNRLVYYLLLFSYIFKNEKLTAIHRKSTSEIDPVSDFRPPFSLNELLHEGLSEVQSCFNQMFLVQDANVSELLTRSQITIAAMINSYDAMIGSSKLHSVYRDDRDYLQTLIDRIDNLIADLERGNKISDQDTELLRENITSLHVLKGKLNG